MRRRIALIAPPWYPVPPRGYGGIELVVSLLTRELRSHGDDVVVFAAHGSALHAVELAPAGWMHDLGTRRERLRELTYAASIARALQSSPRFDVIHDHCGMATLLIAATAGTAPVLHTVHGVISDADHDYYASLPAGVQLAAISGAQRRTAPALRWAGTVYNAVDTGNLMVGRRQDKRPYLLCLARICADKGQHIAIEVAQRAGLPLVLAGKVEETPEGREYFQRLVAPAIDGDRVAWVVNVEGEHKARLLAEAVALLAPLQWEEPFGLAMAEAMVSGTPVIAFPKGAAPEVVTHGATGMLVSDVDAMVNAVESVADIDPELCAQVARARFSPEAMGRSYRALYDELLGGAQHQPAMQQLHAAQPLAPAAFATPS